MSLSLIVALILPLLERAWKKISNKSSSSLSLSSFMTASWYTFGACFAQGGYLLLDRSTNKITYVLIIFSSKFHTTHLFTQSIMALNNTLDPGGLHVSIHFQLRMYHRLLEVAHRSTRNVLILQCRYCCIDQLSEIQTRYKMYPQTSKIRAP